MIAILFLYGLVFILMGMILLAIPKNDDLLGILKNFWALALFGLFHGAGEWVDMFIKAGGPFDAKMLSSIGAILLPVSLHPLESQEVKFFEYLLLHPKK